MTNTNCSQFPPDPCSSTALEIPYRYNDRQPVAKAVEAVGPVRVAGPIIGPRHHGAVIFLDLRDPSGEVQILAESSRCAEADHLADVLIGSWVGVEGAVGTSRRGAPALITDSRAPARYAT